MKEAATLRAKGEQSQEPPVKKDEPTKKIEIPPGGSPIKPEEQYAVLLKQDRFSLNQGKLWIKPPKGSDFKAAKIFWNTHCSVPRVEDNTGKAVYAGFAFDSLRPNSPLRELKAKLMGEQQPKEAESVQGPAKPEKELVEQVSPAQMTLLIPADQKAAYINLKKSGKFPATDLDTLKKTLAENPSASLQLGEDGLDEVLMMAPEGYNRLPGHVKTLLMHEMRCRVLGLHKISETDKHILAKQELTASPNAAKPKLSMKEMALARSTKAA